MEKGISLTPKSGLWINYQLKLAGLNHDDVARKAGVTRPLVTNVIAGRRSSERVKNALCSALGYPSWQTLVAASRGKGRAA